MNIKTRSSLSPNGWTFLRDIQLIPVPSSWFTNFKSVGTQQNKSKFDRVGEAGKGKVEFKNGLDLVWSCGEKHSRENLPLVPYAFNSHYSLKKHLGNIRMGKFDLVNISTSILTERMFGIKCLKNQDSTQYHTSF